MRMRRSGLFQGRRAGRKEGRDSYKTSSDTRLINVKVELEKVGAFDFVASMKTPHTTNFNHHFDGHKKFTPDNLFSAQYMYIVYRLFDKTLSLF